ncbi:MAG: GFA family protein [Deltaproteobacteria bacterium]|nr:GFA family protein [Deltaproteobacteria bacterium]
MTTEAIVEGGCHCGAVRFNVHAARPEKAYACNCSICSRAGWLLTFVPADRFELLSGADAIQDYQFGKKHLHHGFCRHCGVRSFSRGTSPEGAETVAVNLRCVPAWKATELPVETFDGASL